MHYRFKKQDSQQAERNGKIALARYRDTRHVSQAIREHQQTPQQREAPFPAARAVPGLFPKDSQCNRYMRNHHTQRQKISRPISVHIRPTGAGQIEPKHQIMQVVGEHQSHQRRVQPSARPQPARRRGIHLALSHHPGYPKQHQWKPCLKKIVSVPAVPA